MLTPDLDLSILDAVTINKKKIPYSMYTKKYLLS